MQIIIDIPEEDYKNCIKYDALTSSMYKAIQRGTPLDDLRAEIEPTRKMYLEMNDIDWLNGCDYVLSVIDKYREEQEE